VAGELCVASEAVDRADLGEQFRCGDGGAAGQLEQRRRHRGDAVFEFLVEVADRPVELPDDRDEVAGEPHLQLLVASGKPARDALELGGAVEATQGHLVGRVELVEMPAQPLLALRSLRDEIVAVVHQ
jgi:hypothetical protein